MLGAMILRSAAMLTLTVAWVIPAHAQPMAAPDVLSLQSSAYQTHTDLAEQGDGGEATLTNLNPAIGSWYLLEVIWPGSTVTDRYHLEVPSPTPIRLTAQDLVVSGQGVCRVLTDAAPSSLRRASSQQIGFVALCDDTIFLRKNQIGSAGGFEEWGANYLRSQGLEWPIDLFKEWRQDAGLQSAKTEQGNPVAALREGPKAATVSMASAQQVMHTG